jgi:uncharacterized protein (TIGR03790 family)
MTAVVAAGLIACGGETNDQPSSSSGNGGSGGTGGTGGTSQGGTPFTGTPQVILPKVAIEPTEVALLVNDQDPQSLAVAVAYQAARGIPDENVVTFSFPPGNTVMSETDFAALEADLDASIVQPVQALVITWTLPYRVDCMSVTSAFAMGFDLKYCNQTGMSCGETASSAYHKSASVQPWTDFNIRPTMMIAGETLDDALAVIDRGLAADNTFPFSEGYFVRTTDVARSVRWPFFELTAMEWNHPTNLQLTYVDNSDGSGLNYIENVDDVLFYFTGLASVPQIDSNTYLPGAVADHLTSFGGRLTDSTQMSILRWLEAGATASYGTVVEPCAYTTKFPDPRVMLPYYFRGATLVESYWKSVAWPGEGIFVGEPLARPWGETTVDIQSDSIAITTTMLQPQHNYEIVGGASETGPFDVVVAGINVAQHARATIEIPEAARAFYVLREVF